MKKSLAICFCIFLLLKADAQNLVPNPSFELYDTCPNTASQIYLAKHWFQPTFGTPDYYNSCSANVYADAPVNYFGNQTPRTGNCYSGIGMYLGPNGPNRREYISTKLTDKLDSGSTYCIRFFFSLADHSRYAINTIGAALTDTIIFQMNALTLAFSPQVERNTTLLLDSMRWISAEGTFVATGNEKYLTIGNFRLDNQIQVDTVSSLIFAAYYYIDDVFVGPCSDTITPPPPPPPAEYPFAIYPNPTTGNAVFSYNFPTGGILEIYNSLGQIVYRKEYEAGSSVVPLDLLILRSGFYYWRAVEGNVKLAGDRLIIVR